VRVRPEDAYGLHDPSAVFEVPRDAFPEGIDLRPGVEVESDTPDGPVTFVVRELTPSGAVIDANHPLAGKTLQFDVEIVTVREASADEIAHGHVHGAHGHAHDGE
jgi:FKBP-type peptidyl-prolyl cis-trans isomerase SlyD